MIRRIAPALALLVVPFTFALLASRDRTAAANPPLPTPLPTLTATAPVVVPTVIRPVLPVVINFDNVASGTVIDTSYAGLKFAPATSNAQGTIVPIPGAHIYAVADATIQRPPCTGLPLLCNPVGGNVVTMNPPSQNPWIQGSQGGIQVNFAAGKAWVSIMARPSKLPESLGTVTNEPYLVAYGPSGYLGEAVYPLPSTNAQWGSFQTLQYNAPAGQTITSVILSTQQRGGPPVVGEFDNLSYPQ